jgi:PAS domain S-box-containing protein
MGEAALSFRSALAHARQAARERWSSNADVPAYLLAVLGTVFAFAVTTALEPLLQAVTLPPFIAAIILAAWVGGFRPGLLATALSVAGAGYLFFRFNAAGAASADALRLSLLGGVGLLSSWMSGSLGRARREAEEHSYQLEEQAVEMELQAADLETANQELAESVKRAMEAEQRHRELVEGLEAVVWEGDPVTGRFTYASPQAETLFGYPATRWVEDPQFLSKLVHPDDRDAVTRFRSGVAAGVDEQEIEYRVLSSDAKVLWVRESAALRGFNGTSRLYGLLVDITAHKSSERRFSAAQAVSQVLASSQDLLTAAPRLLEAVGDGLGWDVGLFWEKTNDDKLHCLTTWRADGASDGAIEHQSRTFAFARGEGLLGEVWESGKPRWSTDFQRERAEVRSRAAVLDGLHASCAFPVMSAERFIGVVEFFCHQPVEANDDSVAMMISIGSQIGQFAERRRAETQLLESAHEMRALISAMTDVVLVLDADGKYITIAPSGDSLLYRPADALLGKRLHEVFDKPQADFFLGEVQKALRFGTPVSVDYSLRIRDRTVWFTGTVSPMTRDRVVWVARDVTQKREAERQLVERSRFLALEAEIATIVTEETSLHDILQLSCEAIVRHFDSVFARVWVYEKADRVLVQESSCGAQTPFDEEFRRTPLGTGLIGMIAQDRAPHLTNEVLNDPRTRIRDWARASGVNGFAGYPLLAGDELLGVVATYSRQRLSENAITALRSVSDRMALVIQKHRAEKALQQSEDQLRQAQKMEAIGQLAGGVAHDFNNLLTVISSYSTMALEDLEASNPMHADILEIHKAAHRAAALTRQLLAFSRKQVLEPRVLDLNDVVINLDRMLQRLIGEDINLVLSLDKHLGYVSADPGQVEQVIINLAVNARDAMPEGGRLNIETANIELDEDDGNRHIGAEPGAYVMLAVSDTGKGMDPETLERAFEPFFTTKEQGHGTGLGLSTVYGIIKQSGGDVWVYSEVGHGTTFKVFLPRLTEEGELTPFHTGEHRVPKRGTELVLLVEDDESVRTLAARVLRDQGYVVLEAPDGAAALEMADSAPSIDLVLTDVVMPKMSGRALGEGLAARHPKIRTLFMSGYTDDEVVRRGILDARTAFLQKPFTPASLAAKVREVLDSNG